MNNTTTGGGREFHFIYYLLYLHYKFVFHLNMYVCFIEIEGAASKYTDGPNSMDKLPALREVFKQMIAHRNTLHGTMALPSWLRSQFN